MKTFIMNAFALSKEQFELIDNITHVNDYDMELTLKVKPQYCPKCNRHTTRMKDYAKRKISHSILLNRDTTIFYNRRRYFCKHCNASFIESNPFTMKDQSKVSSYSIINILKDLKPYNSTFSAVARKYNISTTKVIEIFDSYVQISRKPLSRCLNFDEFYFHRHSKYKYAFMIMDFEKKVILDILESRQYSHLSDYFFNIPLVERHKVEYICIDMYRVYRSIALEYFKNATVCIDSFLLVKKVKESLKTVSKRMMRPYKEDEDSLKYRLLKYRYKLLLKHEDDINSYTFYYDRMLHYHTTENRILEELLNIHKDLRIAYKLKELYLHFNNIEELEYDKTKTETRFRSIVEAMETSEIEEFMECAKTLTNWKIEILNSFVWIGGRRISNGPIEGKNNYLKKIIHNANGLKNFQRARNRFIFSQNLYEKHSLVKHENTIKQHGNKRGKYKKKG